MTENRNPTQDCELLGVQTDVAIVGFGPVGAALAALLGKRGVRVTVVERDAEVYPLPRAAHIDHQGLRLLQEIGCLDALLPDMIANPGIDFVNADGEMLVRIPGNVPSASGLPASMYFFQPVFDRALRAAASAYPSVDVRLNTEMVGLSQTEDHVRLELNGPSGEAQTVTASWVVGCDGAWSPVREAVGVKLDDYDFHENWIVVDLLLTGDVPDLPTRAVTVCDPSRPTTMIPVPNGRFRIEMQVMPDDNPAALQQPEHILDLVSRWVPKGSVEIERSAVYNFHGLVARPWRVDRVFVAGDAAHQMPPFLGQGMCSGLRDAVNLAWKLERVIHGRSSSELLDLYETERRPHVTAIIEAAVEFGRITCITDPVKAAERDHRWLNDPLPASRRLPFSLPGLGPGPLVNDSGGELFIQPRPINGEPRLDDVVGSRFLVLMGATPPAGSVVDWWRGEVGALVTNAASLPQASYLTEWLAARNADTVIVRPDRYVLAVGGDLDEITGLLPVGLLSANGPPGQT